MALALYYHPLASFCQKVLIALYENDTPFTFKEIGPDHPDHIADWQRRWPIGKFPVLVDGDRTVAETSSIIEYLQLHHAGPVRLIPGDPEAALDVRFLDRFFDLHIMDAAQHAVNGALTGDDTKRAEGMATTIEKLNRAYPWIDAQLAGRSWAAGGDFTLADCAAAPALFYADWIYPIPARFVTLRAYRARLLARPSFARAVDDARYFRPYFPLGAPDRD